MARGLRSLLFEVTASDPGTFAAMLMVLTSVAVIAGYLPARRASRMDPMVALARSKFLGAGFSPADSRRAIRRD